METKKISRGERNNNPLNLKISKNAWLGILTSQDGIFEYFQTNYFGYRAAYLCLKKHHDRGCDTIGKLINKWAPSVENNTNKYIEFVSERTGIDANMKLQWSYSNVYLIMYHMCVFENGKIIDREALTRVVYEFFTK